MSEQRGLLREIRSLEPTHFEQLIADIWQECQGWATEVTDASRDNGIDVIGSPTGSGQKTAVQAKCYSESNKVTSEQIQQYAALRQQYTDVQGVTVVTTGFFTNPACEAASHLDVKCINGHQLLRIIQKFGAEDIVDWYVVGKPEDW